MPDVIYPGANWRPGVAADYTRGRNNMQAVKLHYTVGRNSSGIGLQGYFQILVSRDGSIEQYAEIDAVCWDAGNFNRVGPGIEIEYHPTYDGDEITTPEAKAALAGLFGWLNTAHGFPLTYFDVESLPQRVDQVPPGFGFISHRSFDQAPDNHTDYLPYEDWLAIIGATTPSPPPLPKDDDMPWVAKINDNYYLVEAGWRKAVADPTPYISEGWPVRTAYEEWFANGQCFAPKQTSGSGGGLSEADVTAIINKTKLSV